MDGVPFLFNYPQHSPGLVPRESKTWKTKPEKQNPDSTNCRGFMHI